MSTDMIKTRTCIVVMSYGKEKHVDDIRIISFWGGLAGGRCLRSGRRKRRSGKRERNANRLFLPFINVLEYFQTDKNPKCY